MEEKEFFNILRKYLDGKANREEEDFINKYYDLFDLKKDFSDLNIDEHLAIGNSMKEDLHQQIKRSELARQRRQLFQKLAIAASILIVCSVFFYLNYFETKRNSPSAATTLQTTTDVPPGSNKAVLTLANGEKIILNGTRKGVLAREGNAVISKTGDGQVVYLTNEGVSKSTAYNTIETPKGGQFQLTLPDGSKVWLNAASSIRFPATFTVREREVSITGEAYFEVAKDKHRPFRVISAGQVVEVLGTHFNINAYPDEQAVRTTLLEGSVRVNTAGKEGNMESAVLRPGFQTSLRQGIISISESDTESAVAWKNGYFKFNRENIETVMRQISRWYDVEVEYRGSIPGDEFVGKISRSSGIKGVLRILSLSNVNCRLEGNKVIINN